MKDSRNTKPNQISEPDIDEVREEHRKLRYRMRYQRALLSTIAVLLAAAALAILTATLWMPVLRIYGTSMAPTLEDGQIVAALKTDDFETGEIVAFYHGSKLLVKRCIAGPGDWVSIDEDGNISVNNEPLDEPYILEKSLGQCDISFPYQVPDGHWFLVGDNRSTSIDSRNSEVGCVSTDMIVGKIFFRVWPLSDFGGV